MKFMQVIEYKTGQPDQVGKVMDDWLAQTQGKRAMGHGYLGKDREHSDTYYNVVLFGSYEEAMRNNDLPETQAFADKMMRLCDGPATFHNLDVIRDEG